VSTKIYEAWKIPIRSLVGFTSGFRAITMKGAVSTTSLIMDEVNPDAIIFNLFDDPTDRVAMCKKEGWREYSALVSIMTTFMLASDKGIRFMNWDTSFNVWLDGRWAYIIPYLGGYKIPKGSLDRMIRSLDGVEYRYWDNSDKPSNLSRKEWSSRARTWDKVCLEDFHKNRMSHVVIDGKYPYIGFQEMANEILGKDSQ
jgi:hypothetical protein